MAAVLQPAMSGTNNARPVPVNPGQALSTRLAKLDLGEIAEALRLDPSTACKIRSGERNCTVTQLCILLDLVGLKLVSKEKQCVPADELAMLRRSYARLHEVDLWSDPE